jgi:hypothetical protein
MAEQRDAASQSIADGASILPQQDSLKKLEAMMSGSMMTDSSAAEGQLLHVVQDWEVKAGITGDSFQRIGASRQNGFVLLRFDVSAHGNMTALATFLYQVETAAIPLRVDNVQISARDGQPEALKMHLMISTLYRDRANRAFGGSALEPEESASRDGHVEGLAG